MAMPVEQLSAFGISKRTIEAWRGAGIRTLLPIQEKVLADHGLLHGRDLLLFAPTASGKTFVAELAAMKHLERRRRVIYMVPTKALAEEKYREFSACYGPLGYRVAVATRERPDTDQAVLRGQYDLLVAVYEKVKGFLATRPEILAGVGAIVADETQMIGEPGRGGTMDLLLTKIVRSPYDIQLICLSAVLGEDASRLAAWLGCDLMVYKERPVTLREGVVDAGDGVFHYRDCNSGEYGEEELVTGGALAVDPSCQDEGFERESLLALLQELAVKRGEQVLVFVPTRYMSRNWAHRFAGDCTLPPAEELLNEMCCYEENYSRELLEETLRSGIGFHNSDLSWDLRGLLERFFNSGAIRVLFSTSTLGQGVNLRCRNVLHVPTMVTSDVWTGRHAFIALSRGRFRNQGGRAGRSSTEGEYGRSILVGRNEMEREQMARVYMEGPVESLQPQLSLDSLEAYVLDLVASKVACDIEALTEFFHSTFSGRTLWRTDVGTVASRIAVTVDSLVGDCLLERAGAAGWRTTGLGEVAASTGLCCESVGRIARWLREGPGVLCEDPIEALVVLASTRDGKDFPAGAVDRRTSAAAWVDPLRLRLMGYGRGTVPVVEEILSPEGGFTRENLGDFRKALVLDAWIGPCDTREIEDQFLVYSGTIANLAGHFSWLAQGAAAMARALSLSEDECGALEELAERLALGCAKEGLAFRSLRVQGFSRAYLGALLREGYNSIQSLADAAPGDLARCIPPMVAQSIVEEARRMVYPRGDCGERDISGDEVVVECEQGADAAEPVAEECRGEGEPLLELDLRGTGSALLGGQNLHLKPLSFRLLTLLARAGKAGATYEEIEADVWADTQAERQQVLAHRDIILHAADDALPDGQGKGLITTHRGVGLSLNLRPSQIRINETSSSRS